MPLALFRESGINYNQPVNWSHPLNRGLRLWCAVLPQWRSGWTWRDLTAPTKRQATFQTMPSTAWMGPRGRPGGFGSVDFASASSDYADTNLTTTLTRISISLWFNHKGGESVSFPNFFGKEGEIEFYTQRTAFTIGFARYYSTNDGYWESANNVYVDNRWYHLCVTMDGSADTTDPLLYIDGKPVAVANLSPNTGTLDSTANPYRFAFGVGSNYTNCYLDGIRIHDRLLSAGEVAQIYLLDRQGLRGLLNRISTLRYFDQIAAAAGGARRLVGARFGLASHGGLAG